jgi:hypothetical protein
MRLRALLCVAAAAGALRAQDGEGIDVNVRVVGPTGCPLPGVQIGEVKPEKPLGRTDASGALRVRVRRNGQIRVLDEVFAPELEVFTPQGLVPVPIPTAKVTGEDVVLRCDEGVAGRMCFVDAETGAEIRGVPWNAVDYQSRSIEQGIVLCRPGGEGKITVTPPAGYRVWEQYGKLSLGPMSCFARSVSAVVPLRKAVEIEILVKDHKGKPATFVSVTSVEVGGVVCRTSSTWDEKSTPGRVRLFVPHFREGRVSVRLRKWILGGEAVATWTTKLGWAYKAKVSGSIKLPEPEDLEPEEPDDNSGIGIWNREPPPADRVGKVVIRARRSDGSAAAGIPVKLECKAHSGRNVEATLDAEGRASFDALAIGRWAVDLRAAGFLGQRMFVDVGEDTLEIDYAEPVGGLLKVTVVDKKDRPLPFAELSLSKAKDKTWTGGSFETDDEGCQRVDMFTDHVGQRTLVWLPPGELTVHARYGARRADAAVTVVSGEAGEAWIVLDDEP